MLIRSWTGTTVQDRVEKILVDTPPASTEQESAETTASSDTEQLREAVERLRRLVGDEITRLAARTVPGRADWSALERAVVDAGETLGALLTARRSTPTPLDPLLMLLNINIRLVAAETFQAALVAQTRKVAFLVNATHRVVRRRASVAHELGHSFFWNVEMAKPLLAYPVHDDQGMSKEEAVCWRFARSLLLPKACLEQECAEGLALSASALLATARRFSVSCDFLAKRLLWDFEQYAGHAYIHSTLLRQERPVTRWTAAPRPHPQIRHLERRLGGHAAGGGLSATVVDSVLQASGLSYTSGSLDWPEGRKKIFWVSAS